MLLDDFGPLWILINEGLLLLSNPGSRLCSPIAKWASPDYLLETKHIT